MTDTIGWREHLGMLWDEISEGTLIWREPSAMEKAVARERRRIILEDSRVPWIVSDLGGILGFYDDVQDVVSFTRWNKKLLSKKGLSRCLRRQSLKGVTGAGAAWRCFCARKRRKAKRHYSGATKGFNFMLGIPMAIALRLFPQVAPIMWALLAGQVMYSIFGVGLRLGAVVGASLETTFRGLSEIGFPFGRDANKWHQLTRARVIRRAERGIGAMMQLPWEDRLTALMGLRMSMDWLRPIPEVVLGPEDYPDGLELFTDPFGTIQAMAKVAASMLPNAIAYVVNDLIDPMMRDTSLLVGGTGEQFDGQMPWEVKAALGQMHKKKCPKPIACDETTEESLRFIAWAKAAGLPTEGENLDVIGYEAIMGTLMHIHEMLGAGEPEEEEEVERLEIVYH